LSGVEGCAWQLAPSVRSSKNRTAITRPFLMVPPRRRFFFRCERWLPFRRRLIERTSPERHWERGLSLSAIAFSHCRRVCTDVRAAIHQRRAVLFHHFVGAHHRDRLSCLHRCSAEIGLTHERFVRRHGRGGAPHSRASPARDRESRPERVRRHQASASRRPMPDRTGDASPRNAQGH